MHKQFPYGITLAVLLMLSGCRMASENTSSDSLPVIPVITVSEAAAYPDTESLSENKEEALDNRIIYQEGFYYEPLSDDIKNRISGISYQNNPDIALEDLRYVSILYYDFDKRQQSGELICNKAIAQDLVEIFYELYLAEYPLERVCLIDEYHGDDNLSMQDNNSSCFNYRKIARSSTLSKHALGLAVDINPFFNPYVTYPDGSMLVEPEGADLYADRTIDFTGKITHDDLAYQLFTAHGFTWGGDWKHTKDYQHFQKTAE